MIRLMDSLVPNGHKIVNSKLIQEGYILNCYGYDVKGSAFKYIHHDMTNESKFITIYDIGTWFKFCECIFSALEH
jgi:hypothetical protein